MMEVPRVVTELSFLCGREGWVAPEHPVLCWEHVRGSWWQIPSHSDHLAAEGAGDIPELSLPLACHRHRGPVRSTTPSEGALTPQIALGGLRGMVLCVLCGGPKTLHEDPGPQEPPEQVARASATVGKVEGGCACGASLSLDCGAASQAVVGGLERAYTSFISPQEGSME